MAVGLLETMGVTAVGLLPMAKLGLAWVVPVCLSAGVGLVLDNLKKA
jgi:branched-subunit amino acid permease